MWFFSSRGRWAGSWAQLWPETCQKPRKLKYIVYKAKNHYFPAKSAVCWPWYPKPPKITGPINHYGIPLTDDLKTAKPHKFIGFGAMDVTKPYKFIGFGAMDATKPYKFIGFLNRRSCRSAGAIARSPSRRSAGPCLPAPERPPSIRKCTYS